MLLRAGGDESKGSSQNKLWGGEAVGQIRMQDQPDAIVTHISWCWGLSRSRFEAGCSATLMLEILPPRRTFHSFHELALTSLLASNWSVSFIPTASLLNHEQAQLHDSFLGLEYLFICLDIFVIFHHFRISLRSRSRVEIRPQPPPKSSRGSTNHSSVFERVPCPWSDSGRLARVHRWLGYGIST